jgi:DNA repair exonuclease SbcCD ATPase subunit
MMIQGYVPLWYHADLVLTFAPVDSPLSLHAPPLQEARVTVEGSINEIPFVISRSKTASKGNLFFQVDGVDLTTQSVKETQAVVEERLGVDAHILGRTVFHGQHIVNDLLESTDTKLKEELSLLVPLGLWQQASSVARSKSRLARRRCDELGGMLRLRTGDVDELSRKADAAKERWEIKQKSLDSAKRKLEEEMNENQDLFMKDHESAPTGAIQSDLERLTSEIDCLNEQYESMRKERDSDVQPLEIRLAEAVETVAGLVHRAAKLERNSLTCTMSLQSAKKTMERIEKQWSVDLSSGTPPLLVPPEVCPTCQQPLEAGGGHEHHDFVQKTFEREIEDAVLALTVAQEAWEVASCEESKCRAEQVHAEASVASLTSDLQQLTLLWNEKLLVLDEAIRTKRVAQTELTSQLSASLRASQLQVRMNSVMASIGLEGLAVDHAREVYETLKAEVLGARDVLIRLEEEKLREEGIAEVMAEVGDRFGQRGVQTFVLKNVVGSLQRTSQTYLNQLSDGGQRLELSLEGGDKISRTAFIQGPDGEFKFRPLSTLSGGQWRRCSLAMSLAFADLMAKRGRFRSSLLVLDEPLTHLDRSGRDKFGNVIRRLVAPGGGPRADFGMSTVLVILQDLAAEELEEAFDSIDTVVRDGGDSHVEVDGFLESDVYKWKFPWDLSIE